MTILLMATPEKTENNKLTSTVIQVFRRGEDHLRAAAALGPDYFIPSTLDAHIGTTPFINPGLIQHQFRVQEDSLYIGTSVIGTEFSRVQLRMFGKENDLTQIYVIRPQLTSYPSSEAMEIATYYVSLKNNWGGVGILGTGSAIEDFDLKENTKERTLLTVRMDGDDLMSAEAQKMFQELGANTHLANSSDAILQNLFRMMSDGKPVRVTQYDLTDEDFIPPHIDKLPI